MTIATLFALVLAATPMVGHLPPAADGYQIREPNGPALTLIDVSHPMTRDAALNTATVRWNTGTGNAAGCADAFKLKFLRQRAGEVRVFAERGPFRAANGFNTVELSPPVDALYGDYLAVTQLAPASCGGVSRTSDTAAGETVLFVLGDPSPGDVVREVNPVHGVLAARASFHPDVTAGYVTVVGALAGAFGSSFKTDVQLTNPDVHPIRGALEFRPADGNSLTGERTLPYTLAPRQTIAFTDVVRVLGNAGLGSLDVIAVGSAAPLITTRVYNDAPSGTFGFTQELQTRTMFIHPLDEAFFTVPADLTNFRVNIGVLPIDTGANVIVNHHGSDGTLIGTKDNRYFPDRLFQVPLEVFVGRKPSPNDSLIIRVTSGKAILYATTTDNRTNDSSIRFLTRR